MSCKNTLLIIQNEHSFSVPLKEYNGTLQPICVSLLAVIMLLLYNGNVEIPVMHYFIRK